MIQLGFLAIGVGLTLGGFRFLQSKDSAEIEGGLFVGLSMLVVGVIMVFFALVILPALLRFP